MDEVRILVEPVLKGDSGLFTVGAVVVRVHIVEVGREVAVIVRTGVLGIVPVHSRITVLAEAEKEGGMALELI